MITKKEFREMCIEEKITAIFEKIKSLSRPAPAQEAEEVLTVKQCAALLGYSTDHIYAQVSKSLIPHYRVGSSLRFRKSEVLEWAFRRRNKR